MRESQNINERLNEFKEIMWKAARIAFGTKRISNTNKKGKPLGGTKT